VGLLAMPERQLLPVGDGGPPTRGRVGTCLAVPLLGVVPPGPELGAGGFLGRLLPARISLPL
jgi:hypothetical protein